MVVHDCGFNFRKWASEKSEYIIMVMHCLGQTLKIKKVFMNEN